ncbi:hypothetical protein LIER_02378 [Lithospermum erythrorhizon]|uniref:Reverse transcriptase n=1 Tax=Lithospermum erythrorhizon TaxID=34254 RepID=A0AAV3NP84_LITER
MGDFNDILNKEEKEGEYEIGHPFTWWNKREWDNAIKIKLDHVLFDHQWSLIFQGATCFHLAMVGVDHCPIMLDTEVTTDKSKRRFVFDCHWVGKEGCEEVIKAAWAKEVAGSRWVKIDDIQAKLKYAYEQGGLSHEGVHSLEGEEEVYWKERAKVKLLKEDQNTKFFHAAALIRRRRNRIVGIEDAEGVWQEGFERVEEEVLRYFVDIFRENDVCIPERATQTVDHRVIKEMNYHLTRVVTSEEVRKAMFEMHANKSPWPDGMTTLFSILLAYSLF